MLFSSLVFLFVFFPLILISYYFSPKKIRNYTLLVFSIVFYAWGGVSYTAILIVSILLNYLLAKKIQSSENKKKLWLVNGLILNIIILFVFKYLNFFIDNYNDLFVIFGKSKQISNFKIVLPLGISFFTFQQMSLLWDVYRDKEMPKIRFLNTALYISFFPQLIAGPIVRYKDIIQQIIKRTESIELFNLGVQRFIIGLFKKVVFANTFAVIADEIMSNNIDHLSTSAAWLGIIAYSLQIYFDFSGYSDMAIGMGRMFGLKIFENFNFPYISTSIKEFWRRWHISLSSWFRDYVYIPIGGNRIGISRTYVNLFVVFLLTGFWHGATWSFVFWGLFHGIFLIIERFGLGKILKIIPKPISWLYTILVVVLGWVFFRIENISDAFAYVEKLFGIGVQGNIYAHQMLTNETLIILIIALISCSTIFLRIKNLLLRMPTNVFNLLTPTYTFAKYIFLLILFVYSIILLNSGSYNPFIYFRF